jgi:hypothetical protein
MEDIIKESEPYMGAMTVSRVSGRAYLFDSDAEHHHFVEVTVQEADRERHLSNYWVHPGKQITRVWMTETQWAQFVSSFNQREGVPITLRYADGKDRPLPPDPRADATKFQKEISQTVARSIDALKTALTKVKSALIPKAKALNKTELDEVRGQLEMALLHFQNNTAFVEEQFDSHVEAKLSEAKVDFEGYMQGRLRSLGLEAAALQAAADEAPKFLTEGKDATA